MLQAFVGRDVRPAAHLLFFASPKQRRQKKGDPTGRVPSLRCGQPAMLAPGAVLRNSLRSLRSLRSNNRSKSVHDAWACSAPHARPTPCASRHGQRGVQLQPGPSLRSAPVLAFARAERSDGPCGFSTPLRLRLRRGACGVARAPQDARASSTDSPRLSERSAQRAVSSAAHPARAVTQVCPVATRRGRRLGGAFFCLLFLCAQEKEVRRRAHIPASESQQKPLHIEQQRTNPTPQPLTPTLSPKGRGSKTTPKDRESTLNRGSKR